MTGIKVDPDSRDIEACLGGEEQSFAGLVHRHQPGALRLAWHLLGRRPEAEDAVQEAFLRAWRALPDLRQPGSFRSWLLRTTANLCRDNLRKRKVELTWDEGSPELSVPGPEEACQQRELRSRTALAIRDLPPQYRTLLVLRHGEGLAYQEIADTLGLPMSVVKNRIYRARRMLGQSLAGGPVLEREVVT